MKKISILLFLTLVITNVSCKKKTGDTDTTAAPTITLNGSATVTIGVGTTYTDDGATAKDATGSTISISTDVSNVNPLVKGSYQVVYSATDCNDNVTQKARVVNVEITSQNWLGNWNVSHDVKTSAGINIIKNTCVITEWGGIFTLDHEGRITNGSVSGQNITINPSSITWGFGPATTDYTLTGTGTINDTGDEIIINYDWTGNNLISFNGSGTATYTKQ